MLNEWPQKQWRKAACLKRPQQVGSYAWRIRSKADRKLLYKVHTDAHITWEGAVNASFASCSCSLGATSEDRVVRCAHTLRVFGTILDIAAANGGRYDP